jgi:hypothetical protein
VGRLCPVTSRASAEWNTAPEKDEQKVLERREEIKKKIVESQQQLEQQELVFIRKMESDCK